MIAKYIQNNDGMAIIYLLISCQENAYGQYLVPTVSHSVLATSKIEVLTLLNCLLFLIVWF